jgi:DNA repair protein radc
MTKERNIKELPLSERPYEKFLQNGVTALNDSELLAIILRTGTRGISSITLSKEVLNFHNSYQGLIGLLHLSVEQLKTIKGIGMVKAVQLKCIGELSRRIAKTMAQEQLSFNHPQTIASYYMEDMRHLEQEVLTCIMLDTKNSFLGDIMISKGTVNASLVSAREIFLNALKYQAVNIILLHNHPSGNPYPSDEDINVTKQIQAAGDLIGIKLLDHIIIGDQKYVSFCEDHILPL